MRSTGHLLSFLEKIKNFTELERELANLSSDKEKGDLFELFCQVYLKVIYKKQTFKSILLFKDINATTLQRLNLRLGKDYGIDIVATTDSDDLWTVQVKFRQSDQLTWTELSTFRASSEKATFTMVMSNVSKVNHPHTALTDFSSILRNEFEALTEEDFSIIKAELKGQAIKPTVFSPRPHQIEAILSALNHFKTNNLGQMIHACGTGKTLTSLWIKEALKPKNTIVYVPSLSLLKQILEEYTKHKSSTFSIKCVCSDQSVSKNAQEIDESLVDITELGVPVTTNPKEIGEFLRLAEKEKIIFSTYQSAPVILEAISLLPEFSFDFGVFDEAHRTASKSEHLFAKSLNTPIQKKLFMTATPKLYAPHVKSRAKEEEVLLCSMDDSSLYGEVFHEIKFGEAIKLNLLSDYKIKVITVTNDEIKELIDKRYWLDILGKEITADELAKVWALLKSFDDTNHVISFHSRIYGAKEFQTLVEKTIELLRSHKKEVENVKTYHITGEYPTYQRSKILSDFIKQKKSLVTNARCLTEGVDVPAIDGVYFVDPKQNLIDIVQAVGRAIRKKLTKYGYIIIPVFVKDETDTERIIESSAFGQVWNIVEAMKDQDARLNHIIEELQELKGKKRFGSLKSREQAEERALKNELGNIFDLSDSILPKNIDILEFVEQISVKTLDVVGQSWDEKFGEYKAFKEKYDREPMRETNGELEESLARWVEMQRRAYNRNVLAQDRVAKLNALGFTWNPLLLSWENPFRDYISFKKKYNREPSNNATNNEQEKDIATWASRQRMIYKKNKLPKDRVDRLNSIGFIWDQKDGWWEQDFKAYKEFVAKHGKKRSSIPKNQSEKDSLIWASRQRLTYNKGTLSKDRIDKLNAIGFIWDSFETSWDQSFKYYKEFRDKNNKDPDRESKDESESFVASWVNVQRVEYKRNILSKERIKKLESVGLVWDILGTAWDQSFRDYRNYKKKYNREPSSESKDESEKFLGLWAGHQRQDYKKKRAITQDRIDKLNSIDFAWDLRETSWQQAFNEYREFKQKHGQEPSREVKNESQRLIASWASDQRKRYKQKKVSQDRIAKLNSIGFIWDQLESSWENLFKEYREFKEKKSREPVFNRGGSERDLALWVRYHRARYKINKIPKDHIEKLNAIGFKWSVGLKRVNGRFVSN